MPYRHVTDSSPRDHVSRALEEAQHFPCPESTSLATGSPTDVTIRFAESDTMRQVSRITSSDRRQTGEGGIRVLGITLTLSLPLCTNIPFDICNSWLDHQVRMLRYLPR